MYSIEVKNLSKTYKKKSEEVRAVDQISFSLKKGEILGFLGPNGSGKTTTIQMLLGILTPSNGEIFYFSKDFKKNRSEILNSVAFASTYTSLPYILTVEENLKVYARLYGVKNVFAVCDPLLERFEILDKKKQPVSSLSAGQVTRLMLVKAFSTNPKVVLLDEPTASLDPDVASDVCQFLMEQRERHGVSLLFTSHKMDEVSQICDRVIFLRKGKIIDNDLPKNLAQKVSLYRLRLVIVDNMDKAVKLAQNSKIACLVENRTLELSLKEEEIPIFLKKLVQEDIAYASISIKEPSLEDYFRQAAKNRE